jgi:hypothetical protein
LQHHLHVNYSFIGIRQPFLLLLWPHAVDPNRRSLTDAKNLRWLFEDLTLHLVAVHRQQRHFMGSTKVKGVREIFPLTHEAHASLLTFLDNKQAHAQRRSLQLVKLRHKTHNFRLLRASLSRVVIITEIRSKVGWEKKRSANDDDENEQKKLADEPCRDGRCEWRRMRAMFCIWEIVNNDKRINEPYVGEWVNGWIFISPKMWIFVVLAGGFEVIGVCSVIFDVVFDNF